MPGHTPGSVIVFVALPGGDPARVRTNMLRVAALAARFPEIVLVPAHDARGFDAMPRLTRSALVAR
jgi:glyoxylase-like metal-dependent hydrolase (beta-lactamase superfamily II)